ncbi:5-(carboxyamino)imidazole ribonucleotide synthase [Tetragenococcus halophilus]|uniref:5-(carboxyamino)imidazole ribonucleotide synthase n=1 Tax=Tetragenococcus halophilus TaxID=51669 RepID=UPI0019261A4C|nr:5-(carboxyamino)imidazole ribonucleotide synthase [Tetragenococcus halophilus]MCF1602170.1 5-(carboxyamino)imidazole ribonucleotide synthase [Tetragenococcus halophilus]MDN6162726.1 5-(carboxyamino)imidazole ribonucleotide synthase [Tetragenococcus halophilus]MDN6264914.1 5-(carboxyamino)imidazole ribonucleotide synthase [Tetragenococcus halophilus]MDN6724946.1 5-(carboxyamino)imidazole ribonucleotide synthase [Tetragenococcus halophilus]MDN6743592.1 5-(carboxyamino)imidazole ribonucleotide
MPGGTIGIVGGGQLGKMMAISAKNMGFHVGVLDPVGDCPAAQLANWHIVADCDDVLALEELAKRSDLVTYETSKISVDGLNAIIDSVNVPQGTDLLAITQDRLMEKSFLETNNIVIPPYETIISPTDIQEAIDSIGFPCVLKTTRDTDQQYILNDMSDLAPSMNLLREGTCVLEALIPAKKELSVLIAGNGFECSSFPVVETIHRDSILFETIASADVEKEVAEEVKRIGVQIGESLNLRGILAIEMVLTASGSIYTTKLTPRPHSIGNYSVDVCNISQFDAHIRGICGWPLGDIQLFSKAVTVNILGEALNTSLKLILEKKNWNFYYYGKKRTVNNRKMGHITIPTATPEAILNEIAATNL